MPRDTSSNSRGNIFRYTAAAQSARVKAETNHARNASARTQRNGSSKTPGNLRTTSHRGKLWRSATEAVAAVGTVQGHHAETCETSSTSHKAEKAAAKVASKTKDHQKRSSAEVVSPWAFRHGSGTIIGTA